MLIQQNIDCHEMKTPSMVQFFSSYCNCCNDVINKTYAYIPRTLTFSFGAESYKIRPSKHPVILSAGKLHS